jgi:hypothetical protein
VFDERCNLQVVLESTTFVVMLPREAARATACRLRAAIQFAFLVNPKLAHHQRIYQQRSIEASKHPLFRPSLRPFLFPGSNLRSRRRVRGGGEGEPKRERGRT